MKRFTIFFLLLIFVAVASNISNLLFDDVCVANRI